MRQRTGFERERTDGARALDAYLARHRLTVAEFCTQYGLCRMAVQRALNGGTARISVDFAHAIERATNRKVRWFMWLRTTVRLAAA